VHGAVWWQDRRVPLFVISGVPASGKTTVSRLLASRLDRAVCVPGDTIREMVVTIGQLRDVLRAETPRLGLWLDSTELSAEQTTDRILADLGASLVRLAR
jgi:cytidylate kinase